MKEIANKVEFAYDGIDDAFSRRATPACSRLAAVCWCKSGAKKKTKGGIILTTEARETEHWNTQVAKVIAVGELAFKNRTTMEKWPEGSWCEPGDFVRVPKYGGDRWSVKLSNEDEDEALLVIFNDLDLVGKVTGDPLAIKAFI